LSAIAGPIVDPITLEINGCGVRTRIVSSDNLYRPAIPCAVLFNNNDAIVGLLTRSNARQTDHQHWGCLSKHFILGEMTMLSNLIWTGADFDDPTPNYGRKLSIPQSILAVR
jgi:hypothetical protein